MAVMAQAAVLGRHRAGRSSGTSLSTATMQASPALGTKEDSNDRVASIHPAPSQGTPSIRWLCKAAQVWCRRPPNFGAGARQQSYLVMHQDSREHNDTLGGRREDAAACSPVPPTTGADGPTA